MERSLQTVGGTGEARRRTRRSPFPVRAAHRSPARSPRRSRVLVRPDASPRGVPHEVHSRHGRNRRRPPRHRRTSRRPCRRSRGLRARGVHRGHHVRRGRRRRGGRPVSHRLGRVQPACRGDGRQRPAGQYDHAASRPLPADDPARPAADHRRPPRPHHGRPERRRPHHDQGQPAHGPPSSTPTAWTGPSACRGTPGCPI